LCSDLKKAGLPLRHAGSFGFDFGAAEWFRDTARNRCVVGIAVPDLPTPLWDQVVQAVVQCWSMHEEQKFWLRPLAHECASIGKYVAWSGCGLRGAMFDGAALLRIKVFEIVSSA